MRAVLLRETQTRWGVYVGYQGVMLLETTGDKSTICLDNHHHPAGRCHTVTVPAGHVKTATI